MIYHFPERFLEVTSSIEEGSGAVKKRPSGAGVRSPAFLTPKGKTKGTIFTPGFIRPDD
jgi:hypothetical protein